MGTWGYDSSSNDTTMDILSSSCRDIYEPTQEQADGWGDILSTVEKMALKINKNMHFWVKHKKNNLSGKSDFIRCDVQVVQYQEPL